MEPDGPASTEPSPPEPAPLDPTPTGHRRGCPRCGSRSIARILYGYPAWSEELDRKLSGGELRLGGCVVHACQPALVCNRCGCEFDRDGSFIGPEA
jgi:hypothetical protein